MAQENGNVERLQGAGGPVPVILQREVKITKLMGYEEEPEKVETFIKEVRRAWELTPGITEARRLDFVKDNVGPIVRDEITCMNADLTAQCFRGEEVPGSAA